MSLALFLSSANVRMWDCLLNDFVIILCCLPVFTPYTAKIPGPGRRCAVYDAGVNPAFRVSAGLKRFRTFLFTSLRRRVRVASDWVMNTMNTHTLRKRLGEALAPLDTLLAQLSKEGLVMNCKPDGVVDVIHRSVIREVETHFCGLQLIHFGRLEEGDVFYACPPDTIEELKPAHPNYEATCKFLIEADLVELVGAEGVKDKLAGLAAGDKLMLKYVKTGFRQGVFMGATGWLNGHRISPEPHTDVWFAPYHKEAHEPR